MKGIIKRALLEETDSLGWMDDVSDDVVSFFEKGKTYYMGKLSDNANSLNNIESKPYEYVGRSYKNFFNSPYEDGRGLLNFKGTKLGGTYSPKWVETQLLEKGLMITDLLKPPNT